MKFKIRTMLAMAAVTTISASATYGQVKKTMPAKQVEASPPSQQSNPAAFQTKPETTTKTFATDAPKEVVADRFADIQILRYAVPGFSELTVKQKKLAYYLYEAGLCGRDIYWDQKYKNSLMIRKSLENILETYSGARSGDEWIKFETYCKQVFFANGIHHHYSNSKIMPQFSVDYFKILMRSSKHDNLVPSLFKTSDDAYGRIADIIFSNGMDMKTVDLSGGIDNVKASSNNFYENVSSLSFDKVGCEKRIRCCSRTRINS